MFMLATAVFFKMWTSQSEMFQFPLDHDPNTTHFWQGVLSKYTFTHQKSNHYIISITNMKPIQATDSTPL